eukprot:gene4513-4949_t
MGAAVAVEIKKPPDASDILETHNLAFARSEIVRLRRELGHLAASYGMEVVSLDASDLVLGENEEEDFMRCVNEISHIRRCLQLHTQTHIRQGRRGYNKPVITESDGVTNGDDAVDDNGDSSESDD